MKVVSNNKLIPSGIPLPLSMRSRCLDLPDSLQWSTIPPKLLKSERRLSIAINI